MSKRTAVHDASSRETHSILSGHDIICFAIRAWDSPWKNNQQLMSRLAESNRVLYVNPPRALKAALSALTHPRNRERSLSRRGRTLQVLQEPFLLPRWGRSHIAARLFNRGANPLRIMLVKKIAARLGFRDPILWIYDPQAATAIGRFRERLIVYSVIDNYKDYFRPTDVYWRAKLTAHHQRLLERADVVFAVSESLRRQCLRVNLNSFLLPNGVDFELFQTAAIQPSPDMTFIPAPVIGYVGVIHASIDLGLLEFIATQQPKWSLVLVGPVETMPEEDHRCFMRLVSLPNVYYLGYQRPDRLPSYIERCDVTLMPYRLDPLTLQGDSLKLYEYLARGKPVVTTDLPSARRFAGLVEIARNREDFLQAIQRSLDEPPEPKSARILEAERNSWARRIEAMSQILKERINDVSRNEPVSARAQEGARKDGMHHFGAGRQSAEWQRLLKRLLDVIIAGTGVLVLAPLFGCIAAAIWLTSSGPVLYRWPVLGEGGRHLKAYKFRTMVVGADGMKQDLLDANEARGPVFKMRNDPRVTPVGRILRKFSLDELPQLWSVLKGDMSLVGPRPVLVYEWEQMEPWQRRKLSTKPGIVCLWHIRGQPRDFDEWVKLDLEYVDTWSLWLDLKLILWTPLYILSGRNF